MRKKSGLPKIELAKKAGVGLRFIREVEQGKKTVRIDSLNAVFELPYPHVPMGLQT